MKKLISLLLMMALMVSVAGAEHLSGGWIPSADPEVTEELKALFDKGTETLTGIDYHPIAYLGSQIVAGTNYCFLAQAKPVIPDAQPSFKLVFLYEKLDGTVEVLSIVDFDFGALCEY